MIRCFTLGIICIRVFTRPQWSYHRDYADDWDDMGFYPAYGMSLLPGIPANLLTLVLLALLSWGVSMFLNAKSDDGLKNQDDDTDIQYFLGGTEATQNRRNIVKFFTVPCIALQVLECLINLGSCFSDRGAPLFALSPLEALVYVSLEPCFESPLYYTIVKVLPYFSGLIGILCCVIASWAVFGMLVINARSADVDVDPFFPYFGDSFWTMLNVLNAANWPSPMIPSYDRNHLYFFFFMAFVILVQWGYLNLILGLIISFFEQIWEKRKTRVLLNTANPDNETEASDVVHSPILKAIGVVPDLTPVEEGKEMDGDIEQKSASSSSDDNGSNRNNGNTLTKISTPKRNSGPGAGATSNSASDRDSIPDDSNNVVVVSTINKYGGIFGKIAELFRFLESRKEYHLLLDIAFFIIGVTFISTQYPASVLISQLVTKFFEIAISFVGRGKNVTMSGWLQNSRSLVNFCLYLVLLFFSLFYFSLCSGQNIPDIHSSSTSTDDTPNNENNVMKNTQCRESDLNMTMEPGMDDRIVLCIIVIRTCLVIRLCLITRNLGWDLFPKAFRREYNRMISIINETYDPFLYLVLIIVIFMYCFAAVGMQLYGGKISKKPGAPHLAALQDSWYVIFVVCLELWLLLYNIIVIFHIEWCTRKP